MGTMDLRSVSQMVDAVAASVALIGVGAPDGGKILACNSRFRAMLDLGGGGTLGEILWEVFPRYARRPVRVQFDECVTTVRPVEITQPIDMGGKTRWWRISGQPLLDTGGAPIAILLTCIEITEKVELDNELRVVNSRFSSVIQSANDGVVAVDRDLTIKLFNAAAEEMFGYEAEEIVGQRLDVLLPEAIREDHDALVENFAHSPIQSRQMFERGGPVTGRAADGSEFPVEISIAKIRVGEATEFTAIIRDVSERARLINELRLLASVDPMTGLLNRRALYDEADRQLARVARHGIDLSILMLDLDHFKSINDSRGHAVGDRVITAMASAGKSVLRKNDIFSRIGGEEFAILLPDTTEAGAAEIAERLRQTVEAGAFVHDWEGADPVPFTISIGITACSDENTDIDAALIRADAALYASKAAGRNRITLWSDLPEVGGSGNGAG